MNSLTIFIAPNPNHLMMRSLTPINRWINLKGMKFLHCMPLVNKLPLVRGLCDVTHISFSETDILKLKQTVNPDTVSFITPNHPEFYTDWMLDKEVSSIVAPKMASWATHEVVNGMGKLMQKFWLKNNLIAQIPGTGNENGKNYSIESALKGHSTLLHPEGHVGWHSDVLSPLFSGVVDMAYEAYLRSEGKKEVYISPVVWKLSFNEDVSNELHNEISIIEKKLYLNSTEQYNQLNIRLKNLLLNLFNNITKDYDIELAKNLSIVEIHSKILNTLLEKINNLLYINNEKMTINQNIKEINNTFKLNRNIHNKETIQLKNDINKLASFDFSYFKYSLTQENIAEILQKIRIQFCNKSLLDKVHKFIPRPVGSRTAYIKTPDAININKTIQLGHTLGMNMNDIKKMILKNLENNMQESLNSINKQLNKKKMYNPFWK